MYVPKFPFLSGCILYLGRLIFAILLILLFNTNRTFAQQEIKLNSLEVDIWPEYDRPAVLIIYRITLAPEVILPVEMTLRIPLESGDLSELTVKDVDGGTMSVNYNQEVNSGWVRVTFTATMPEMQLEYYDPRLEIQGDYRQFQYVWPGDYNIESLFIQIQQPLDAEVMITTPALGDGFRGQDGLIYYNSQVGSLVVGQTFSIDLKYKKTSNTLSAEGLKVEPSAPVSNVTSRQWTMMLILPWALALLGVALIVGGGWWYWRTGLVGSAPEDSPRKTTQPRGGSVPEAHSYCRHCGKRTIPGDRFCRTCGTRL